MRKISLLTFFMGLYALGASAQKTIPTKDASKHLNERVTVCDKVFGTKLIAASNMTFLDLGGYHPNELITIVIKGENRSKFKTAPEVYYKGRNVCVTGTIIDYKSKPEIIVTDPSQIKLNMGGTPNTRKVDN